MEGQLTIFDYFNDIRDYTEPPQFDWDSVDWKKYPGLDVYYEAFPETPVYFVVKSMRTRWSPLFYKALICTYTGWWHGLAGWNLDNKSIEYWEQIPNVTVKDFIGQGKKLAWTPEEYEGIKDMSLEEISKIKKERSNT